MFEQIVIKMPGRLCSNMHFCNSGRNASGMECVQCAVRVRPSDVRMSGEEAFF